MKLFSWFLTILLVLCSALVVPNPASAKTIEVPRDYKTIQAAVNKASSGDTILVDNGVYKESVQIAKTRLIIKAKQHRGAVVDGERKRDFGFHALPKADIDEIVIQGFEIRRFKSAGIQAYHKGNRKYDSWEIMDNYIHHAVEQGILLGGGGHTIHNNEIAFIGNSGEAMGIQLRGSTNTTISNNIIYLIRKNGIRVSASSSRNMVKNNLIAYTGPGIAINTDDGANVVMNNYVFTTQKGIIAKHSDCSKGFNRILHNTVIETSEANIVLGENKPSGDCLEVYNNIFADAHSSLIKDTQNRGKKFRLDFNFYDRSFAYMMVNGPRTQYKNFADYQKKTGFDQHSVVGDPRLTNPFLGPQLRDNSPVFDLAAASVKGGLDRQVGARSKQTFPYIFKRLPMHPVKASSNLSLAKKTIDRTLGSAWTASGRKSHSITYELDGVANFDILWMTPIGHEKKHNIKRFAVDISTNGTSFKEIYKTTLDDNLSSAHFHEIGLQKAKFIRVRFLDNFGDSKFRVDDIWVARNSSSGDGEPSGVISSPTGLRILSTSLAP